MTKIIFIYNKNRYEMSLENNNISIFHEYSKNINGNINNLLFLYEGKNIILNNSQPKANTFKINKKLAIIFVYNLNINNNFYICSCKEYICQLCINKHQENFNHNLIDINNRYSICNKHIIKFISYCSICKLNLCEKCEIEHEKHKNKILIYKKEIPNEKKINEIKKEINLIILN